MLKRLEALSRGIGWIEQAVLVACLAIMILFAFLQVMLRFLPGNASVTWLEPFARQLVLWVGLLGASLATAERRHISIEALPKVLKPGQKRLVTLGVNLCAVVITLILGSLSYIWLVEVDREEVATAGRIAAALRERAEDASEPREAFIADLRREAADRVNRKRLRGYAQAIRQRRLSMMRLLDMAGDDAPFVLPARELMKEDPRVKVSTLRQLAEPKTCEWIAGALDVAAQRFEGGERQIAKVFKGQEANESRAAALGAEVAAELFKAAARLESRPEEEAAASLRERAALVVRMADQKAFIKIGPLVIHEWLFHLVVPIALFIMSFRFLLWAILAIALSPEELEAREETLQRDIEAFESRGRSEEAGEAPPSGRRDAKTSTSDAMGFAAPTGPASFSQTEDMPAPSSLGLTPPGLPDNLASVGETVEIKMPTQGDLGDRDTAPPPPRRTGLIPSRLVEANELDDEKKGRRKISEFTALHKPGDTLDDLEPPDLPSNPNATERFPPPDISAEIKDSDRKEGP